MNVLNKAIGLEQLEHSASVGFHDGAIIAGTHNHSPMAVKFGQKLGKQPVLTELTQLHCWTNSGKASAVRVRALKRACIVIETRIDPLHS